MGNEEGLRRVAVQTVNSIDSDTPLKDIDSHFKVVAGPGAGKTYWLIKHVKNVLSESERLNPVSQIACISFTNIASKEIKEKLGDDTERVWVSTIHRFLYHNIVKPYVWLLKDDKGKALVNYKQMRGHSDHYITYGTVNAWLQEWKSDRNMKYVLRDIPKASKCLNAITWEHEDDTWIVTVPNDIIQANRFTVKHKKNVRSLSFPSTHKQELMKFKHMCWKRGDISHNDVLYLSIQILEEYPELIPFLTAVFPYVFVDEFQDTNPMQTELLKKLGDGGAIIGVIGDPGQSIYAFNGASPEDFKSFTLSGMTEYIISGNRRSTVEIIDFLNEIRQDPLIQHPIEKKYGPPVTVLVGSSGANAARILLERLEENKIDVNEKQFAVLARTNEEVLSIRNIDGEDVVDLWKKFDNIDSARACFYRRIIKFVEFARTERFNEAASCLSLLFPENGGKMRSPLKYNDNFRGYVFDELALTLLENLLPLWQEPCNKSLFDVNNDLMHPLLKEKYAIKLPPYKSGKVREFAERTKFTNLIQSSQIRDDTDQIRTIHKAKGAEFNTVLVCLEDENHFIRHFIDRNATKEELQIRYVATSRAIERLYIHVPELSEPSRKKAKLLNLRVLDIE